MKQGKPEGHPAAPEKKDKPHKPQPKQPTAKPSGRLIDQLRFGDIKL